MSVELVMDQCEAVLGLFELAKSGKAITEDQWNDLFSTKGYRWLKQRELGMGNDFNDDIFKRFVLSPETLAKAPSFALSVDQTATIDIGVLETKVKEYLPEQAVIDTEIVLVIKERTNSFVYRIEDRLVVFIYANPNLTKEKAENVLAHELHHVGLESICRNQNYAKNISDKGAADVLTWTEGFGEGYAMLAAAGGSGFHPNQHDAELKELWDQRMLTFEKDFQQVEEFFVKLLNQEFSSDEEAFKKGFSLLGSQQGPWYTVGWQVAAVIEQAYGKERLIECMSKPAQVFFVYNQAVQAGNHKLPLFSKEIVQALNPYL